VSDAALYARAGFPLASATKPGTAKWTAVISLLTPRRYVVLGGRCQNEQQLGTWHYVPLLTTVPAIPCTMSEPFRILLE
jgi:hypothetical protein